jgi:hypothetical protein
MNRIDRFIDQASVHDAYFTAITYCCTAVVLSATSTKLTLGVVAPLPLLKPHLPVTTRTCARGSMSDPRALVIDGVRDVLRVYGTACSPEVPSSAADRRDARPAREGARMALGAGDTAISEQPTH